MEGLWSWIAVYAVGLVVLQVLVYRYLWRRQGSVATDYTALREERFGDRDGPRPGEPARSGESARSGEAARTTEPRRPESASRVENPAAADGSGRFCPHCGVENESESAFRLCWNCASRL
jgi:hypothetical protein